jgi:ribonucleoside-diphosphate reductase alpha chain
VMDFIQKESKAASAALAERRGNFPNYPGSVYDRPDTPFMRNATTTTIAPTGTISIIAGCSSGIEPVFAISFVRKVLDNQELLEVHPLFQKVAKERGFHDPALMKRIAEQGSIQKIAEIPEDVKAHPDSGCLSEAHRQCGEQNHQFPLLGQARRCARCLSIGLQARM